MSSHWSEKARRVVANAITEGRVAGLDGKELIAHVDAAYPFHQRAYSPYKVWLKWRRKALELEGVLAKRPTKPGSLTHADDLTRPRLFPEPPS